VSSGSLFAQVAWLALVASFYPPAMLLAAFYLQSERPGRITFLYVLGGFVVVTVVGIVVLVAMRAGGLSHFGHRHTRYGVRLGLGVLALVGAVILYLRRGKEARRKKARKPNLIQRLSTRPSPLTAFAVGVFMFGPSLAFISAVQVVATAKAGLADTVGAMALIIVLAVAFAWLPFLAYLVAPAPALRWLHSVEGALARHGRTVVIAVLAVIGVYLVIQGITGLALEVGVVASPDLASPDVAARAPAQEPGERKYDHRDAEAKEQDALLVVGLDRDVHEGDRRDQDQHRYDSGLEIFQVAHPQPARQPVLVLFPFLPEHEQFIEAEGGDHQRRADQVGVHHDQEDSESAAHPGRLADAAVGGPQQDVRPVNERPERVKHQEDDRNQGQEPGAGQQPLELPLQPT
jgi:Sap, sulfolipid-1-addressing protein